MRLRLTISVMAIGALGGGGPAVTTHAFVPSPSASSAWAKKNHHRADQPLPLPALFMSTTENEVTATAPPKPGTADVGVPWSDLGFAFRPTKSHLQMKWTEDADGNGSWGPAELVSDPYVNLHIGATALHYGQSCFEGLKAFAHEDDSVHIFRPDENAKR
jgi:hypothetical protein